MNRGGNGGPNPDAATGSPRRDAALTRLAHRGDHRRHPENSLAAMAAAMALPTVDGVEFDIRFSADGEPILLHDQTLDRVHGVAGAAPALSAIELGAFGVPTLADVLAAIPVGAFLDIELKDLPNDRFAAVLRTARGERPARAVVSSFEVDALAAAAVLLPEWPRWLNAERIDRHALDMAARLGCRGIAAEHSGLDARGVARTRGAGLGLATWTLTTPADERRVVELGVDVAIVEGAALADDVHAVE